MIDLALSVSVIEVRPQHQWQTTDWAWKVSISRPGKGRVVIDGRAPSRTEALHAASIQCAAFVETQVSNDLVRGLLQQGYNAYGIHSVRGVRGAVEDLQPVRF